MDNSRALLISLPREALPPVLRLVRFPQSLLWRRLKIKRKEKETKGR
jgi:hypothetical protein